MAKKNGNKTQASGKQKLKFKGIAAIGEDLATAASDFVKVLVSNKSRQLIVASDGSVYATKAISKVTFWDPKSGMAHAKVLAKDLNLTTASDGKEGQGVLAHTAKCPSCKETIIAESKLDHCILCAAEIPDEEYEPVELDIPANPELDAMCDSEDEGDEDELGDALEGEDDSDLDEDDEDGDALEGEDEGDEDELGDALESDSEDEDIEIGDDLEDDADEEDNEELSSTKKKLRLKDTSKKKAIVASVEDEDENEDEAAGDALEDDEDFDIEDDETGDALEGDEDENDEDELGDALEDDEETENAENELGDALEGEDEGDEDELGDALEGDDVETEEDDEAAGDALEADESELDEDDEDGDALEGDESGSEEEVDSNEEDGDFYIDDDGAVNIDLVDGAELDEGDECDVEFSAAMSGNKRWIASVNSMPVAYCTLATAGQNKEIFATDAFGKVAKEVIAKSGIAGLKAIGFTPIVIAAPIKGLIQASVDAELSKSNAELGKQISTVAADFRTALGMAAAGINRGFFSDVVNPLKVRMWEELSAMGIPQPHRVIDRCFKETAEDFCKVLIEKASELHAKPVAVRAELSKAIVGANYIEVSSDEDGDEDGEGEDTKNVSETIANRIEASTMPFASVGKKGIVEESSEVASSDFSTQLSDVFKTL